MNSSMKAIGFPDIKSRQSWEDLAADVLKEPSRTFVKKFDGNKVVMEYHKEYGDQLYLLVRVALAEEVKDKPKVYVEDCEAYVESTYTLEIQDLEVEGIDEDLIYYAICEDVRTGMEIVFYMQNIIDYLDASEFDAVDYTGANIVGICSEGTIVLPIEKAEDDEEYETTEREYMRTMLQRAKIGDKDAIEILKKEEEQLDEQLQKRLYKEDFLTVMDGYFLPATYIEATYAVLGTIKELGVRQNTKTKEEMYWLYIDINGMFLEVIINKKDLIGHPSIGMRFVGTCKVQGTVAFE